MSPGGSNVALRLGQRPKPYKADHLRLCSGHSQQAGLASSAEGHEHKVHKHPDHASAERLGLRDCDVLNTLGPLNGLCWIYQPYLLRSAKQ